MKEETELAIIRLINRYAPEWIDITVREPATRKTVLFTCPFTTCGMIVGYRASDGCYYTQLYPDDYKLSEPTHWMELPVGPNR